jgi:hypothetical protein
MSIVQENIFPIAHPNRINRVPALMPIESSGTHVTDVQHDVEHVRVKVYDMVPNVLTSWTYNNLVNKVNKVQKVK